MKRKRHLYLGKLCQRIAGGICMFALLVLPAAVLFSIPADAFYSDDRTSAAVYTDEPDADSLSRCGNTLLNSLNNGLLVEDGHGFFYKTAALKNSGGRGCICRLRTDAPDAEGEPVAYVDAKCLSLWEDWLYYINGDDGFIHRMRTDGTQDQSLFPQKTDYFLIADGQIYFSALNEIFIMDLDGSNARQYADIKCSPYFSVQDGWVYYVDFRFIGEDNNRIYRIRDDGKPARFVAFLKNRYENFAVIGNTLYYTESSDDGETRSIKPWSLEEEIPINDWLEIVVSEMIGHGANFNISDGWLYYPNALDDNKLYRVRLDGSVVEKTSDTQPGVIYSLGKDICYADQALNWYLYNGQEILLPDSVKDPVNDLNDPADEPLEISGQDSVDVSDEEPVSLTQRRYGNSPLNSINLGFILNGNDGFYYKSIFSVNDSGEEAAGGIYRINPSDPNDPGECIVDGLASNLNLWEDWIYYYSSQDNTIRRVKTDGTQEEIVLDRFSAPYFKMEDGRIYFTSVEKGEDSHLYVMDLDSSEVKLLTDAPCSPQFTVYDGWVYYIDMRYNGPPDSCRLYRIKDDGSPARFVTFLDRMPALQLWGLSYIIPMSSTRQHLLQNS